MTDEAVQQRPVRGMGAGTEVLLGSLGLFFIALIVFRLTAYSYGYDIENISAIVSFAVILSSSLALCYRGYITKGPYAQAWYVWGFSLLMCVVAQAYQIYLTIQGTHQLDTMPVVLLLILYKVPLVFILSTRVSDPRPIRLMDAVAATVLGALFVFLVAQFMDENWVVKKDGYDSIIFILNSINVFLAVFATLKFLASVDPEERNFYGALTTFFVMFAIYAHMWNNYFRIWESGGPIDIFYDIGYKGLVIIALFFRVPSGLHKKREQFARVVQVCIPFILPFSLVAVSLMLASTNLTAALVGFIAAIFIYAIRMIYAQLHSMAERDIYARMSSVDPLTGLANRRTFDAALQKELARSRRSGNGFAIVMVDIDHFKLLNDTLGHQQGDLRLCQVAHQLERMAARAGDVIGRYGGEEFIALLPSMEADAALAHADRMRASIEALALPAPMGRVTVSVGVSWFDGRRKLHPQELVEEADRALYASKHAGRNRVTAYWNMPANHDQPAPVLRLIKP